MRFKPLIRILALLAIAGFGGLLLESPQSFIQGAAIGIIAACAIGILATLPDLWRSRSDPYDLSKLFDPTPESPNREVDDEELVYCWVCGDGFPKAFDVCPHCGNRFRG